MPRKKYVDKKVVRRREKAQDHDQAAKQAAAERNEAAAKEAAAWSAAAKEAAAFEAAAFAASTASVADPAGVPELSTRARF